MNRRDLALLIPEPVRRLPADLVGVVALTILAVASTLVPVVNESAIRVLSGLVFVLFLPGYAFIAALFPERGESPRPDGEGIDENRGIDWVERLALGFGMSVALVPLIGLVLTFSPWGLGFGPIVLSLSGFTLVCVAVAAARRQALSPDERFSVPWRTWTERARTELFDPDDRVEAAVNVALALSIVLALATMGYAIASPQQGERFTEFYLVTEGDDGEYVAAGYPEEFVSGESQPLVAGIENREHETVEYSVVIQLQRVDTEGNDSTVVEREEVDRLGTTLAHNESEMIEHEVTPTMTGEDLRLTYLLYKDDPPSEPTRENAYRSLHIWVDVE
ncbi:DUF1616 domain-containing protein [Natronorarus salvus]|uniref:DUF1616 domain-containing protein n=1 Tax=Natronorarus salvus TaxID=3117733 RepID=UPI002F264905